MAVVEDSWFSLEAYSRSGEGYTQGTSEVAIIPLRIEPGELAQRGELSFSDVADILLRMRLSKAHQILLPVSKLLAQAEMEINNVTWYQSHGGVFVRLTARNRGQCKRITPLSHSDTDVGETFETLCAKAFEGATKVARDRYSIV